MTVTDACKPAGIKTNAEKNKYFFMCRTLNAAQNHNINISKKSP
jgi:hypothetical protein